MGFTFKLGILGTEAVICSKEANRIIELGIREHSTNIAVSTPCFNKNMTKVTVLK